LPFWSHPLLKPLPSAGVDVGPSHLVGQEGDGDNKARVEKYKQHNLARVTIDSSSSEGEGDASGDQDEDEEEAEVVDMGEDDNGSSQKTCKEELESHLQILREFCDGIEYQVQFQDQRFLKTLENEGGRFFRLAQNCLSCERCLILSHAASPATWEKSTSNALFYRVWPRENLGT